LDRRPAIGPLILRLGTEAQRERILPGIVRGEWPSASACRSRIPDRTSPGCARGRIARAGRLEAERAEDLDDLRASVDYMIALVRTSPRRRAGRAISACRSSWWT
jgi:alkylation response protein AidB-like acyl-CoA dehydrogenase